MAEFYDQFNCRNEKLRKNVGLFEVENIDNANVITITLAPKEYYERFVNYSDTKKHKGIKKLTPDMDFDSYSNCLCDLTEYFNEFLSTDNKAQKLSRGDFNLLVNLCKCKVKCNLVCSMIRDFILQMD